MTLKIFYTIVSIDDCIVEQSGNILFDLKINSITLIHKSYFLNS